MVVATAIGATLLGTALFKAITDKGTSSFAGLLRKSFKDYKLYHKTPDGIIEYINVRKVTKEKYGYKAVIELPSGLNAEIVEAHLSGIEQSTGSTIRFRSAWGRTCEMEFGTHPLPEKVNYHDGMCRKGELSFPVLTPFGLKWIDLRDESSCHILNAGATRMGKSVLLRLLIANTIKAMEGNIDIHYINHKVEDTFPLENVPQIHIAETQTEALTALESILESVPARRQLLRKSRSVNAKEHNEKMPESPIHPILVVIDEYGRFADNDTIQNIVMELAETAGYLDIHLVIATQRPDASTVLKPRIKANMLTRLCFQTADEANSTLVLGTAHAAHLGYRKGRAILLDGLPEKVQVPFVSGDQAQAILNQYRSENHNDTKRQDDPAPSETLPSFVTGSTGFDGLCGDSTTVCDSEPHHEATGPRRTRHNRSTAKR